MFLNIRDKLQDCKRLKKAITSWNPYYLSHLSSQFFMSCSFHLFQNCTYTLSKTSLIQQQPRSMQACKWEIT